MFCDEANETLERLGRKIEAEKIENVNKIKAYRIRIKSIKQEAKRERKGLRKKEGIKKEGINIDIREMRLRIMKVAKKII